MGGGYETKDQYANTELNFLDIENIHKMRESLFKLQDVCSLCVDDKQRFALLQNSQWLHHIKAVLTGAQRIADVINQTNSSALIHCSDGWDRTSQLSSLAQVLLNPFYRTIIGFEVSLFEITLSLSFIHNIVGSSRKRMDLFWTQI